MTKIELATEIATLENDIRKYRGEETMEGGRLEAFVAKTSQKSKAFLEGEADRLAEVRKSAKEKYYRDKFADTESGKSLKARQLDAYKAWLEDAHQQALATVQEVLGGDWTVGEWGSTYFVVGMKNLDIDPKAAWRTTQFGHEFTVYYGLDLVYDYDAHKYNGVFNFKANIGTMGSFNIAADDSQLAFHVGIGKFLASPKVRIGLRDELAQLHRNIEEMKAEWKRAEDEYVSKAFQGSEAVHTA